MHDIKELQYKLEEKIINSNSIIIIPHLNIDFDALSSSMGLSLIASALDKKSFIIIDDQELDYGVKNVFQIENNNFNFITSTKYLKTYSKNDLFILVDVNKSYLIPLKNDVLISDKTFIIDHHRIDDKSIKSNYKYIYENYSSASEIITDLLLEFNISIQKNIANYLLAGIYLDTNKLTRNVNSKVFNTVSTLIDLGADINEAQNMLTLEENSIKKVQDLISISKILSYNIGIICGREYTLYTKEELAKAADCLLDFDIDASFVIGYINDNTLAVSARSKGNLDVAEIMKTLNGGGNKFSAATKIYNEEISEVSKQLIKTIKPNFYINNN